MQKVKGCSAIDFTYNIEILFMSMTFSYITESEWMKSFYKFTISLGRWWNKVYTLCTSQKDLKHLKGTSVHAIYMAK